MSELTKLQDIREAQKAALVERDNEIDGVWLTLLSGEHGFLFGPPGVAKSLIVEDAARYFNGFQYFYHLMARTTVPEELYGPISLTQLKQDKYQHQIDGYLPTADIAFLDEGFKAGATILNTLLRIMNERKFRHGVDMLNVPLRSMFLASNEIPTEAELNALYDRILFRFNVQDLSRPEHFARLLRHEDKIRSFLQAPPVATISAKGFAGVRAAVDAVQVPERVLGSIVDIRDTLAADHGITASSRRWLKTLKGVRAHAYMAGRSEAEEADLISLSYMLWNQLSEIDAVNSVVWQIANPVLYAVQSLRDDITMLLGDLEDALKKSKGNEAPLVMAEYGTKLDEVKSRVQVSFKTIKSKAMQDKYKDKFEYMTKVLDSAKIRLAVRAGGIDPKSVASSMVEWRPESV